ncbi:MAG: hypothetical protein A2020_13675 [Lentisphaerae bacterium GWF2_45_14]|nr:MAG: hypothetical protein A2020_13675 [Lentisphaerae bacterium GWF2_45_14]
MKTTPHIGEGLYTIPDAAHILKLPQNKLRRWLNGYWEIDKDIIWSDENGEKFFNFYTLIEIYTINAFRESGLSSKKIKDARKELKNRLNTNHPFASTEFLIDHKVINAKLSDSSFIQLNSNGQIIFDKIIEPFCEKIDFYNSLAERYWPNGKETSTVVVDPSHCFGKPSILNTNIPTETIFYYYKAGEKIEDIAAMYEVLENNIRDAVKFEGGEAA